MDDLIRRGDAINAVIERIKQIGYEGNPYVLSIRQAIRDLPSAQPERLTDDDFETIRIHLNAYKEKLCNQQRWKEAEEYQRIIDRFMAFASAQPERTCEYWDNESKFCALCRPSAQSTIEPRKGKWIEHKDYPGLAYLCSECGYFTTMRTNFCPNCGADMKGE